MDRIDKIEDDISSILTDMKIFEDRIFNRIDQFQNDFKTIISNKEQTQTQEQKETHNTIKTEIIRKLSPEEKKQFQKAKNCDYYNKNRDRLLEKARIRSRTDPSKQLEYNKKYLEKNKERLNKLRNEKINCSICNGKYTYTNYTRHLGTEKHINAMNITNITNTTNTTNTTNIISN